MKYKASFLAVPCWFEPETAELTEQYSNPINRIALDLALNVWMVIDSVMSVLFEENYEGCFPIKIYKGKK